MIIKSLPDIQKAKSLIEIAKVTLDRLNSTDKEKYPSNTLVDYYEIIHKLMEALASVEGTKIKGEGAHFELINHICKTYQISEAHRQFIQDMREYRNRISYEGFNIKRTYIISNTDKISEIIMLLQKLFDKKINNN